MDLEDLRREINVLAQHFAQVESNPRPWLNEIVYLLQQLEGQALSTNPYYQETYEEMLEALKDTIRNHQATGGW